MIDQQHPLSLPHPHHQEFAKDVVGGPLYLHQQRTLEVIQLIEVPAPPRVDPPSTFASSSTYTSSDSDSDSDDNDSDCESYCSSDPEELDAARESMPDDTYKTRQNRVLAWRETFAKGVGATVSIPHTFSLAPPLKRKADDNDDYDMDDDTTSHSSKRSRPAWQQRSLSAHSCPACDESFSTRQSLQQHGRDSHLNNACRVAVEYGLEP
ncbi:hypothetical protein CERSUDRAFT_93021 [Gelatoporia subvermispora B]|uniref:C2H2-type domain-containing protein n=1 Tax=Ceriporiopsis subvermispora (strain B) TaxID=914234 RepID=M2RKK2_CERS8|nr:hypothetical protein CERSUDRAFT_93021 [Gelatoporia subvermispora B]